mmetsp:Transcript_19671/g.45871  ORF Transcript_19671/g.45871 Transcript_19671/m.45871 type:complete len:224 (-) Transcript_19671:899-1570(-)
MTIIVREGSCNREGNPPSTASSCSLVFAASKTSICPAGKFTKGAKRAFKLFTVSWLSQGTSCFPLPRTFTVSISALVESRGDCSVDGDGTPQLSPDCRSCQVILTGPLAGTSRPIICPSSITLPCAMHRWFSTSMPVRSLIASLRVFTLASAGIVSSTISLRTVRTCTAMPLADSGPGAGAAGAGAATGAGAGAGAGAEALDGTGTPSFPFWTMIDRGSAHVK